MTNLTSLIEPLRTPNSSHHAGPRWLLNARVPVGMVHKSIRKSLTPDFEGLVGLDLFLNPDGTLGAIFPHGREPGDPTAYDLLTAIDLEGRVVMTCFAEMHAHIDKTQTWERAPNQDGSFNGAKAGAKKDRRKKWSYEDTYKRMNFALESAYAHGTRSLRTHIDSQKKRTKPSWQVFDELRRDWAGRVHLQGVISLGVGKIMGDYGEKLANLATRYGAAFGPVIYPTKTQKAEVMRSFDLAQSRGLALDFHVDETLDPTANGLEVIAREAMRRNFKGQITCGHVCSLAMKPPHEIDRICKIVKDAGISLTSLPMTNLYLQDRDRRTPPRWRGLMPIGKVVDNGIICAIGGDNCRDAFHPYGDYDMLEVYREGVRMGHLDNPAGAYGGLVSTNPEKMMGVGEPACIKPGAVADLVIFSGRSLSQVFSRPGATRAVIRAGCAVDAPLPDFPDL